MAGAEICLLTDRCIDDDDHNGKEQDDPRGHEYDVQDTL